MRIFKSMLLWVGRKLWHYWPWRAATAEEQWDAMADIECKYTPRALSLSRTIMEGWDRVYRELENKRVAGGYAALELLAKSGRMNRKQLAALRLVLQLTLK